MHESLLIFLRVGVHSSMLRQEMQLVPAVTSLNVDGSNMMFVKLTTLKVFAVFSASKYRGQLKIPQVTLISSFLVILLINKHCADKNQMMTLPLNSTLSW